MSVELGPAPVEAQLARQTISRALVVGPVVVLAFWLTRGWDGAWSSALGVGIVVLNFWLAGAILTISSKISLQAYHVAAVIGFFLRLALLAGAFYAIVALVDVDRVALGVSAVIAYLTLLILEALAVSRRGRESNWTG